MPASRHEAISHKDLSSRYQRSPQKRSDLIREARSSGKEESPEDFQAIDRVLGLLGFEGDIEAATRFKKREPVFRPGELMRAILDELRTATAPIRTRAVAAAIIQRKRIKPCNGAVIAQYVDRVEKALSRMRDQGLIQGAMDENGLMFWARKGAAGMLPPPVMGGKPAARMLDTAL
jgi:hypothetical protein